MTTLLLPGLNGSGPGHWQHRWLHDLPGAVLVAQRDWAAPDRDAWVETAVAAIAAHPGALLVGHSLGAVTIAHVAAARPDLPIGGALLVAPADVEAENARHARVESFAPMPIRPFRFPSIVVASRDDPWMSLERARIFANLWESAFVDIGAAGHINAETGLGDWAQGRALLARIDRIRVPVERRRPPSQGRFAAAFA